MRKKDPKTDKSKNRRNYKNTKLRCLGTRYFWYFVYFLPDRRERGAVASRIHRLRGCHRGGGGRRCAGCGRRDVSVTGSSAAAARRGPRQGRRTPGNILVTPSRPHAERRRRRERKVKIEARKHEKKGVIVWDSPPLLTSPWNVLILLVSTSSRRWKYF